MDFNTAQEHRSAQWARSSNHAGGNRVPFAPEDIAMPPPWLLPNQQPQVAFPVAQAQVRSFFDEEVVEWPPRSAKKSSQTQYVPEPSQHPQPPPQIIHTTLQPPRRQWTETSIRPVQHIRFEADRQSTSQRPQAEKKAAPAVKQRDPAAVTQHVVDLKKKFRHRWLLSISKSRTVQLVNRSRSHINVRTNSNKRPVENPLFLMTQVNTITKKMQLPLPPVIKTNKSSTPKWTNRKEIRVSTTSRRL